MSKKGGERENREIQRQGYDEKDGILIYTMYSEWMTGNSKDAEDIERFR